MSQRRAACAHIGLEYIASTASCKKVDAESGTSLLPRLLNCTNRSSPKSTCFGGQRKGWLLSPTRAASVQVALISAAFLNSDARCFGTFLSHRSLRRETLDQLSGAEKKLVPESAPSRGFLELGEAGGGCCATSATPEPVVRHATPGGGGSLLWSLVTEVGSNQLAATDEKWLRRRWKRVGEKWAGAVIGRSVGRIFDPPHRLGFWGGCPTARRARFVKSLFIL